MSNLNAIPLHLKQANEYVKKFHRHNDPTVSGKFAVGVCKEGRLVGAAIAGRPVARKLDDGKTLEILRVCTDGTQNACSFLYSRCLKIARLMGYERVITYTLTSECGASLKALGAKPTELPPHGSWNVQSRPRGNKAIYHEPKTRWELT